MQPPLPETTPLSFYHVLDEHPFLENAGVDVHVFLDRDLVAFATLLGVNIAFVEARTLDSLISGQRY
jgi:hypothetical protein